MKKELPIDIIQILEQAEASCKSMAILLGSYYQNLVENKVPEELARDLVLDFHNMLIEGWRK